MPTQLNPRACMDRQGPNPGGPTQLGRKDVHALLWLLLWLWPSSTPQVWLLLRRVEMLRVAGRSRLVRACQKCSPAGGARVQARASPGAGFLPLPVAPPGPATRPGAEAWRRLFRFARGATPAPDRHLTCPERRGRSTPGSSAGRRTPPPPPPPCWGSSSPP